jgi:protein TonB
MQYCADVYTVREIALAARVQERLVAEHVGRLGLDLVRGEFISAPDAIRLVRLLGSRVDEPPLSLLPDRRRRTGLSLVLSGAAHLVALLLLVTAASLGLLSATDTDEVVQNPEKLRLVFLMSPGPGGGGGGGGLEMPAPPPPAKREAPLRQRASPVPPVRRLVPPQRPDPPQRPTPPPPQRPPVEVPTVIVPPPPPAPAVNAPVVPVAADPVTQTGLPVESTRSADSQGPGRGGGVGTGSGTGLGEGEGSGLGPGSGGGTGGGPFRPGSGIEPPVLIREIRPVYTTEARRRAVEGDVLLDIVVRDNGTVGAIRVTRGLDAGLDQKAIEAVRQWRFQPARRRGTPVEVVVEVAVEFKLRHP